MSHAVKIAGQPPAVSTATVYDFICLFTHDLRRKQKRWQDGRLKFHTFNKRYMVYDDRGTFVGDGHWPDDVAELCEGVEMEMDRGGAIVQVGEVVGEREQDLTEILDKRAREVERRREAAGKTPRHGPVGRAVIPQKSPFEERREGLQEAPRLSIGEARQGGKRRREVSPPSKMGHAQSLFGTRLSLVATVPMKVWRQAESEVGKRLPMALQAEQGRCRDSSPEPLHSIPSNMLAGRDGRTKEGVKATEGTAHHDETPVRTSAASVPMKTRREVESEVGQSRSPPISQVEDRCKDSSPEPLHSIPLNRFAGQDGRTKKSRGVAMSTSKETTQHDETPVKTSVTSAPMKTRRREVGESELEKLRVETRRSPPIPEILQAEQSPEPRTRSRSTPSDVSAGRDRRTKKVVSASGETAQHDEPPVKKKAKKKGERTEVDTRQVKHAVTENIVEKSVSNAQSDEAAIISTSEEQHDETLAKMASKKKRERAGEKADVDTRRHVKLAVPENNVEKSVYKARSDADQPPTKKTRTDETAADASLVRASEGAKRRTELRIKPRKRRGLLMVSEKKAPSLKEATPEPSFHRSESPQPPNPVGVIKVAESFTEPLTEPEPVLSRDASDESDEPVSRRQRKRAKAVPDDSSCGNDGSPRRRPTRSRAASPLLGSSDDSDEKRPRRSRRNAKKPVRDEPSMSSESEGMEMPSRAAKQRKSESSDKRGPRITKMARKSVKSKEIFGLAVSSDAIAGSFISVPNNNLGAHCAESREKTPIMEEGQSVDEKADGPPRPKITNPATRGKKAARKEDAAGQVPRCIVPFDPVIVKPRVIRTGVEVDGPGPEAVAGTHVAAKAAPATGEPAGTALGFIRANGGAWSRHAEDLLGMERPAGRISRR